MATLELSDELTRRLLALRASVEKESTQMREDAKRLSRDCGHHGAAALMNNSADALDAALRGGA